MAENNVGNRNQPRKPDHREGVLLEQRHLVYRLALRLTGGCQAEAEDVTQEALITALTRLPFFLGKSRLTTWLYTITVRTWRARQKQRHYQDVPLPDTDVAGNDDWNTHLTRFDLDRAVRTLPEDMREAFVLVKAEGLSHKQAARILEVPLGTVLWRVREACLRLRPLLLLETEQTDDTRKE